MTSSSDKMAEYNISTKWCIKGICQIAKIDDERIKVRERSKDKQWRQRVNWTRKVLLGLVVISLSPLITPEFSSDRSRLNNAAAREQVKIDASVIYRSNSKLAWRVSHNFRKTHPEIRGTFAALSRKVRSFSSAPSREIAPSNLESFVVSPSNKDIDMRCENKFERYPIWQKEWSFNWLKLIYLSSRDKVTESVKLASSPSAISF